MKQQDMERDGNSEKTQVKGHKNNKSTWKHECEAWISEQRSLKGDSRLKLRNATRKQICQGQIPFWWVDNLLQWIISGRDKVSGLRNV